MKHVHEIQIKGACRLLNRALVLQKTCAFCKTGVQNTKCPCVLKNKTILVSSPGLRNNQNFSEEKMFSSDSIAPLVMKIMFPSTNPIFIVVSLIVVLMEDRIQEASNWGSQLCRLVFTMPQTYSKVCWAHVIRMVLTRLAETDHGLLTLKYSRSIFWSCMCISIVSGILRFLSLCAFWET